ncbi:MAG: YjbF family lipoprotein [Pseudomonadota bacterium]
MRAVLALLLGLAACSSDSSGEIRTALVERFRPGQAEAEPAAAAPAPLTRAAIEATGQAMLRARLVNETGRSVFAAQTANRGYVTYQSQFGQFLTLQTTLVTASRGAGFDLLAVSATPQDPLVSPRPVAEWPNSVPRVYRFAGQGPLGREVPVICRYEIGDVVEIEIVERRYRGPEVREICEGSGVAFTNLLFADESTGFVWRSRQWLGPDQGRIDIEVLEPFG